MKRVVKVYGSDIKTYRIFDEEDYRNYGGVSYLTLPTYSNLMLTFEIPSDWQDVDLEGTIADCCAWAEDHYGPNICCWSDKEFDELDAEDRKDIETYGMYVSTEDGRGYWFEDSAFEDIRVSEYKPYI